MIPWRMRTMLIRAADGVRPRREYLRPFAESRPAATVEGRF